MKFELSNMHNAIEVSKSTWDVNGNTALANGIQVAFGGGLVLPAKLAVGDHYFVCTPHAALGMKGIITVQMVTNSSDVISEAKVSITSNIVSDYIQLNVSDVSLGSTYSIIDILGHTVASGIANNSKTVLNVSNLPAGYYFVECAGNDFIKTVRFLKK